MADSVICLPMYAVLTDEDVERVINSIVEKLNCRLIFLIIFEALKVE